MKLRVLGFLDAAVEYALYGVIFFIPISISLVGIFAGLAIVCFLIKKIVSPDFSSIKANKIFFIALLLFFGFMGLSLFNSGPLMAKSLTALFIKWGRFPLLLWIIIDTFRDIGRILKGVQVLLFSAALVGLTVFSQKFLGLEFLRGRFIENYSPSIGPFKNQNSLAAYLTCIIPIALAFSLWRWKKGVVKLSLLLVTGLLILASVWTTSRGGLLGLIAGLIFIILVFSYSRIKKVFWPIFLSSYLFFMPLVGIVLLFSRNKQGSNSERLTLIHGALRMIKEHPFLGKGVGTFMDYCALYTNNFGAYYVHNCYLQIWAESGVFSLLSFLLFVGYVFYRSIEVCLRTPKSLNLFIFIGLNAGLLAFLVHSSFEVHLYSFQLSFLFWVVLGLTVALGAKLDPKAALVDK
ncbi:MAG: O-antigen ligase family protein [Candidatus Omnitrophica bacterium]|nr:O-antigen ligase family protein [Candidatus Omnitrophota bacterium]